MCLCTPNSLQMCSRWPVRGLCTPVSPVSAVVWYEVLLYRGMYGIQHHCSTNDIDYNIGTLEEELMVIVVLLIDGHDH
jgi:hypothetical protein